MIVALDGSSDGSEEMLGELDTPYRLRVHVQPSMGAASARNNGAALTTGDILLFLDDDIEADPELLQAHLEAHDGTGDVIIGYSKPRLPDEKSFIGQALRRWWEDLFTEMAEPGHRFDYRDLLSGNFSVPRRLFDGVGQFDSELACREDFELGLRLLHSGARLRFARKALGHHHDGTTLKGSLVRAMREGEGDVQFAQRHPDLLPDMRFSGRGRIEKTMHLFVFRLPWAGDLLAGTLRCLLPVLEALKARWRWTELYGWLRRYWYLRGMASAVGSLSAFRALEHQAWLKNSNAATCTFALDGSALPLRDPVPVGSASEVTVKVGSIPIGALSCQRGAEPLRSAHLHRFLERRTDSWAYHAGTDAILPPGNGSNTPATLSRGRTETVAKAYSVGEVDLDTWQIDNVYPTDDYPDRLLARRSGRPIGWVRLRPSNGQESPVSIRDAVLDQLQVQVLRDEFLRNISHDEVRPSLPAISVVICTRDRTENMRRCLRATKALDYPEFEVIVVDNAPTNSDTEALLGDYPGYRYVREERPGLDWARNRGLAEARHAIIAFTDDDTRVDRLWLRGVARAFSNPDVMAMTGFVAPMRLDTPPQRWFEDHYGGMGKGMEPRWFRGSLMTARELLWASRCGVGANMAVRRDMVVRIGGFDPALDVGTASRGGGDIEYFHRVLARGHTLLYEPSAIVWHQHREEWDQLRKQISDNGCSFVAFLMTCQRNRTVPAMALLRFTLRNWICGWLLPNLRRRDRRGRWLARAEIMGALQGYGAYRRARRECNRLAEHARDDAFSQPPDRSTTPC